MKIFIFLFFLIIPFWGFSQINGDIDATLTKSIYLSIFDGEWTDHSNWAGDEYPAYNQTSSQDAIFIMSNINLGNDLDVKSGTVIEIVALDTLTINGDVTFRNGSVIYVEPDAILVINGNLTNNNNSDQVIIDGKIIIDGDFYGGNGSTVEGGGDFLITGSITTDGTGSVFGSTDDCDGTLGDCSRYASGLLPVEIISFDALEKKGVVVLSWATASELNNDYFTIEKSTDLIHYKKVTNVDGLGNSNYVNEYSYTDRIFESGTTYYRLKQTDFDGTVSIVGIISVESAGIEKENKVDIYPNPVSDNLGVHLEKPSDEVAIISLISDDGRVIYKDRIESGFEVDIKIPMQEFSNGIYFLQIEVSNEMISKRVIKL